MIVRLNKISLMPISVTFCALHSIFGFMFGMIVTLGSVFFNESEGVWALGAWAILIFPLINAVLGFFVGAVVAICYNFVAQWTGGIRLEYEQEDAAVSLKM